MDLSTPRQDVARGLLSLEGSMERLVAALAHSSAPVTLELDGPGSGALKRACEAYSAIDYRMDDTVSESIVCVGVIRASTEIARLATAVNDAKSVFKEICIALQGIRVRIPVNGDESSTKAIPAIRLILRNIQRSDLNLLAAYRKIPLLMARPASISFTRANTRGVYRKSIDEIDQMLANLGSHLAMTDRERLASLDRRERYLALVKDRYRNIRANVRFAHLDSRGRGRIQIAAELPLMYPLGKRGELPLVRFPKNDEGVLPRKERPSKLAQRPFLESLPIYRYAPES